MIELLQDNPHIEYGVKMLWLYGKGLFQVVASLLQVTRVTAGQTKVGQDIGVLRIFFQQFFPHGKGLVKAFMLRKKNPMEIEDIVILGCFFKKLRRQ